MAVSLVFIVAPAFLTCHHQCGEVVPRRRAVAHFGSMLVKILQIIGLDRRTGNGVAVDGAEPGDHTEIEVLLFLHLCQHPFHLTHKFFGEALQLAPGRAVIGRAGAVQFGL